MTKTVASLLSAMLLALAAVDPAAAQAASGDELLPELRKGGLVIVLRHASSPRQEPDAAAANPDNPNHERQLDETGRAQSAALGGALKTLGIPVGRVLASPSYRTLETARLAGLPDPETFEELATAGGPGGMAPDPVVMEERGAWLRRQCADAPAAGTNTFIVTHAPNMAAAFSSLAEGADDGYAMVFMPDGAGASNFIGAVRIDEWPALAAAQ